MRLLTLTENKDYADALKVYKSLSYSAKMSLYQWTEGNMELLRSRFMNNDDVAQDIILTFEPVRERMKQRYGNTIKLYRGVHYGDPIGDNQVIKYDDGTDDDDQDDNYHGLTSWTSDKKVASTFAQYGNYPEPHSATSLIPYEELEKIIDDFHAGKVVTFNGIKYMHVGDNPESFVYRKLDTKYGKNTGTGTDFSKKVISKWNQWRRILNKQEWKRWKVLESDIDIDRIVWVLMMNNENEYIVSDKPLK